MRVVCTVVVVWLAAAAAAAAAAGAGEGAAAGDKGPLPVRRMRWTAPLEGFAAAMSASYSEPVVVESGGPSAGPLEAWAPAALAAGAAPGARLASKVAAGPRFAWACCQVTPLSAEELLGCVEGRGLASWAGEGTPRCYYAGSPEALGRAGAFPSRLLEVGEATPEEFPEMEARSKTVLWLGSAGATTPLHHDAMHNFFVQLSGRKRFVLYPPSAWRSLYLFPRFHLKDRNAQLNVRDPLVTRRYPRFADARPLEVVLEPGELLYLPPLWFHQVEAVTAGVGANTWSPVRYLERMMAAWQEDVPLSPDWDTNQLMALTAAYVHELAREVFGGPGEGRRVLRDLLETRYEPLYGAEGTGPYPPANVSDVAPPLYAEIDLESPEAQEYRDYLGRLEGSPNFVDTAVGDDGAAEGVLKADHDRPPRGDYERFRGDYEETCSPNEVEGWVGQKQRTEFGTAARSVARVFRESGAPRSAQQIYFGNYIEDLMAQLVGEEQVYSFFKSCVMRNSGATAQ